jgi:hypothetical protein
MKERIRAATLAAVGARLGRIAISRPVRIGRQQFDYRMQLSPRRVALTHIDRAIIVRAAFLIDRRACVGEMLF